MPPQDQDFGFVDGIQGEFQEIEEAANALVRISASAPPQVVVSACRAGAAKLTGEQRQLLFQSVLDREVMDTLESDTRTPAEPVSIDFRALNYVKPVDENLICPICHAALVDPVDTDCGHTFCKDCIVEALVHNPSCPIDRNAMTRGAILPASIKIIRNQLDALQATCPLCEDTIRRSMLVDHVARYCPDVPVQCASKTCEELIRRKLFDKGCLHFSVTCPDCQGELQEVNLEDHREKFCEARVKNCEHCGIEIKYIKKSEHFEICPDVVVTCTWAHYGCDYSGKRNDLDVHKEECRVRVIAHAVDSLRQEISFLREHCKDLSEKNLRNERHIKFLEGGEHSLFRAQDIPDLSNSSSGPSDGTTAESLDTPHDYLLNLLEAQQNRMGQLSASMTELDARQSMLIFNEAMSRQTEIAELRSAQQVISMHVRWLMNFRRQENQRRGYGAVGGAAVVAQPSGSGAELPLPRRLSDSATRDLTKL